ncbi:MAG: NAD(P)H-dependent oxidoreductase subunit E [Chitinivibrionales bacterium]|nr:NAD(P)H-dependent oxidoreductase subunit E [Chitinivibrionales bacterium]
MQTVTNDTAKKLPAEPLPPAVQAFAEECFGREHPRSFLIPILHRLQAEEGYLKKPHLVTLARMFDITVNEILSVATFYHYFTLEPKGRHTVSVCLGTACHVKGASDIARRIQTLLGIKEGEVGPDGLFSMEAARCVGMCALAPVVIIDGEVYGNVKLEQVEEILATYGYQGG